MAGESVVGALRVILGLDTVSFEDGLNNAAGVLERFGATLTRIAGGAAVVGAFAAIGESVLHTVDTLEQLGKAAEKTGTTAQQFSALSFAAKLADVGTEQLATSMEKLAKNMSAAAGGAQGPASEAFKALGIDLRDANGQLKSTTEVLDQVADKFAGFRDSAAKTALAIALFGRAGADMIPLLNQGSAGFASAADEARKYGLIVSDEAVKAAEEFNDNLKRLSAIMQGVMLQATAAVSGELRTLSTLMVTVANSGDSIRVAVSFVTDAFNGLIGVLSLVTIALDGVIKNFSLLVQAANAIIHGDFAKLTSLFEQYVGNLTDAASRSLDVAKAVTGLGDSFRFAGNAIGAFNQFAGKAPLSDAPIIATKTAYDKFLESINKTIAARQSEIDSFGLSAGAIAAHKLELEALTVAQENNIKLSAQQKADLTDLAADLQNTTDKLVGLQIIQSNLPIWDQFADKIRNVDTALRAAGATDEAFFREHIRLSGEAVGATAGFFGFLAQGAAAAASQNKQFAFAAKALAIAQATINTYEAATKAFNLFGGWPLGAAAAAATVAAGLGLVAKISAQQFATGGSFKVGGGLTHADTQLVSLALSPGEVVDVKRSGPTASGVQTINLAGIGPRDLFTGSMLRDLVEALNQGQRDGYKLMVA